MKSEIEEKQKKDDKVKLMEKKDNRLSS